MFEFFKNIMKKGINGRKLFKWSLVFAIIFFISVFLCNYWIVSSTAKQLFTSSDSIPARKVALVLGASKLSRTGHANMYFTYRMQAAYELWVKGKVKFLLLSGDNHIKGYDEPSDMREALIILGVPDSCIVLDYAGFRTLDSVVRCKEIFGEDSITIVSQEFHNQRALFISNKNEINAIAFNAKDVYKNYSFRTRLREYFARVKCVLDIYLLHTSPKFLGKKIEIK